MPVKGLLERFQSDETVVVAEGYIFEFERSGYLSAGAYVPEVVLEYPHLVKQKYEEFVHAGSDVVLAFTYYGQREKLRVIGREDDTIAINTAALKMAREVADKHGCLMAGNICNSSVYVPDDKDAIAYTERMFKAERDRSLQNGMIEAGTECISSVMMFLIVPYCITDKEQIELAVKYGADYIVAESYSDLGEAMIALNCIKKYGSGLPAVITMMALAEETTAEGTDIVQAMKDLEDAGADVVGLNCGRGPETMIPILKKIKEICKVPIAALPVTYRTTPEQPTFQSLKIPETGNAAYPLDVCACQCSRQQIKQFARKARDLGIQYVGLCCGNYGALTRIVAEEYGRIPPASRFGPHLELHFALGDKTKFKAYNTDHLRKASGAILMDHR